MSNYPESADVFVNKTGSDNIASSDPNNAFDGVEATQGLIGALGKPQSWSTTLLTVLREYQRGLRVEAAGGSLYVRKGEAVLESTDGNLHAFRKNTGDVTLSTTEIDAGAIAATFYYVYMYGGTAATTGPIIYSTDALSPFGIGTAPYKKIGWFHNAVAASLTPTFAGAWRDTCNEPNIVSAIVSSTDATASTTYDDIDGAELNMVTSGKPVEITGKFVMTTSSANAFITAIIEVDGTEKTGSEGVAENRAGLATADRETVSAMWIESLAAGAHVIKLKWKISTGNGYAAKILLKAKEA